MILVLAAGLAACGGPPSVGDAYLNGHWYDGAAFVSGDRYSIDGALTLSPPDSVENSYDLGGGFVIPALGDAHTHLFDDRAVFEPVRDAFRDAGVLYAKSLNNSVTGREEASGAWSSGVVSVAFANGGVTTTLGHPALLYETLVTSIFFARTPEERQRLLESRIMDGDGYHLVDTVTDWPARWAVLRASNPDFVKIYLLNSQNFDPAMPDTIRAGAKGLDPTIVPEIVDSVHAAGLRVSAHVESGYDFRVAVEAGVDEIAHLPGYGVSAARAADPERYSIDEATARAAAEAGIVVVATASVARQGAAEDADLLARALELQARNLELLKGAGVRIAIGSDANTLSFRSGVDAWYEVQHLRETGVFTDAELLRAWAVVTPQAIFPDRAVGGVGEGDEATFLVLPSDPLSDLNAVRSIRRTFKDGAPIER